MRQCEKCGRQFSAGETVCPDDGMLLQDTVSFEEQAVGKTLDGKYKIDGFLKRGGMGAVYRGTHLMLSKPVAIKLIKPELVSSTDVVRRFLREARAAAQLSHPNIVVVHDLDQTQDGMLYIAMELVDGASLKELIVQEGAWEPIRAIRLLRGIGSALALAHRKGIVHRDLKPQNIMVSQDPDGGEIPKLLDFGIAKTFEPTSPALTSTGMVLGTPHYMSAEQAKGLPADQRSDLYALGVILYEMLVGKVPFDDTSIPQILIKHLSEAPKPPTTLNANIPRELEAVVLRCLEKDPDDRYQSAEELMTALDDVRDTAAAGVPLPTIATAPEVGETAEATKVSTMAGGAAAPVAAATKPPLPPSPPPAPTHSGTVRAHELKRPPRPQPSGRSPLLFVALAVPVLALLAWLVLRGGRDDTVAAESVAAVSEVETPTPEPASGPASESAPGDAPEAAGTPVGSTPASAPPSVAGAPANAPPSVEGTPANAAPPSEAGSPAANAASPQPGPPVEAPVAISEPAPPAQPSPPRVPAKPVVAVACEGVRDGCAALRFAIVEEARKHGVQVVRPPRGDVVLRLSVEEIEVRRQEQFGTMFVTRTYGVDIEGSSRHFSEELFMEPHEIVFDSQRGRDKLKEQARLVAADVVAETREYWGRNARR